MFWHSTGDRRIMRWNLSFLDNSIEKEYLKSLLGYKQISFRFFQIAVLVLITLSWFLNPLSTNNNFSLTSILANSLQIGLHMTVAAYLCLRKFRHPEIGVFLLQMYNCFGYVESYQKNISLYKRTQYITSSTLLEMNILVPMMCRSSWKMSVASSLILNTYLCLRFTDIADIKELRGLPLIFFFANFIIITVSTYFNEKYDRCLFYERYSSERSLKRYEELIREVLPSSVLIYKEGELMFFNEETVRLLKLRQGEAVEKTLRHISITSSEFKEKENKPFYESLVSENLFLTEELTEEPNLFQCFKQFKNFRKKEGFLRLAGTYKATADFQKLPSVLEENPYEESTKFLEIKMGRINWQGEEALITIISEDFSSQKLQYLQEQAQYKDKLLATVSHDLRTPLNGVIGLIDLVFESLIDYELRKRLFPNFERTPEHLSREVLRSRYDRGRHEANQIPSEKEGNLIFVSQPLPKNEEKHNIYSDPNRLKQVILDLLGNALKFTQKGSIKITCELKQEEQIHESPTDNQQSFKSAPVVISVEDTGCGIKKEDIPKLFKLFGMLNNPESKKINTTGVGLGLAISQNLIKILNKNRKNGEITVTSEFGKGSVFSFPIYEFRESVSDTQANEPANDVSLDCCILSSEDIKDKGTLIPLFQSNASLSSIRSFKAKKNVLLVDDDQINILVFNKILQGFSDCQYTSANNGQAALEIVESSAKKKEYFDIVFMDCNMPVMDGFEATKRLNQMVRAREIPKLVIIASTANTSQMDKDMCLKCGMADFMSKPFTKKTLREKIDLHHKPFIVKEID